MDLNADFPYRAFISLPHRQDRRDTLLPRLAAACLGDAEWFRALPTEALCGKARGFQSSAKRSLALGKRLLLRLAQRRRASALLLLEDDVVFHPEFAARVEAIQLPEAWGIFFFGCLHVDPPSPVAPGLVRVTKALDHHAVAIRAPYYLAARAAMGGRVSGAHSSDVLLAALQDQIPTYAAYPNLAWQSEGYSDLAGRSYSNYHPDGRQRLFAHAVANLT